MVLHGTYVRAYMYAQIYSSLCGRQVLMRVRVSSQSDPALMCIIPVQRDGKGQWWSFVFGMVTVLGVVLCCITSAHAVPGVTEVYALLPGPRITQWRYPRQPRLQGRGLGMAAEWELATPSNGRHPWGRGDLTPGSRDGTRRGAATESAFDEDSIKRMRIKEIKTELKRRGLPCDDCFEKQDLVDRLLSAVQQTAAPTDSARAAPAAAPEEPIAVPMQVLLDSRQFPTPDPDPYILFGVDAAFPASPLNATLPLLVDTGATWSVLNQDAAQQFGAMPTGASGTIAASFGAGGLEGQQVSLGRMTIADQVPSIPAA